MIDLYTAATGNGRRAAIALAEAGLPFKAHKMEFGPAGTKSAAFLKINPLGAIPAIVDPDGPGGKPVTLTQSGAILLYAAEKSGRLLPKDGAARALALQWLMHALHDVAATSSTVFYVGDGMPNGSPAATQFFEERLVRHLAAADARLGQAEYLAGALGVADLALYPVYVGRKALADAKGLKNLARWGAALAARPGVQQGMAACG
jgi:GST-like protein